MFVVIAAPLQVVSGAIIHEIYLKDPTRIVTPWFNKAHWYVADFLTLGGLVGLRRCVRGSQFLLGSPCTRLS
jgi:hypothetical protein